MACCCASGKGKASTSCLGRCDLPKHKCLDCNTLRKSKPVPKNMGWHYTAKDSPEHQLRCGWRPGHISCAVLRRIEEHNCEKHGEYCAPSPCRPLSPCCLKPSCSKPVCCKSVCGTPSCIAVWPPPCCNKAPCGLPLLRIVRHGGQYSISTEPSSVSNAPSGPYPLKYVFNTDGKSEPKAKYSVEAKYNDYQFDYTSSTSSFVLDFTPPDKCVKKSACRITCMRCEVIANWPPTKKKNKKRKKKVCKTKECVIPICIPCDRCTHCDGCDSDMVFRGDDDMPGVEII